MVKAIRPSCLVALGKMMDTTLTPIQFKDIDKEACKALQEYFASCSVIISSKTPGFEHGTGVAVKYRNESYILTAAHVLQQEPINENILVSINTTLNTQ